MSRRFAKVGPFRALDSVFQLSLPHDVAATLSEALVDLRAPGEATPAVKIQVRRKRAGYLVRADDTSVAAGLDLDEAVYAVISTINGLASKSTIETHTLLHGGAVEFDGVGVAFVGPSGTGKSTLTARCVQHGAGFVADEVVAITALGEIRPFHRPIGLRAAGLASLGMPTRGGPYRLADPRPASGLGTLSSGVPLGLVAMIDRSFESVPRAAIPPATALRLLANESLGPNGVERLMFGRLSALVRDVPVVSVSRHESPAELRVIQRAASAEFRGK